MTARTDQAASAVAEALARLAEAGQDAHDQAHTLLFAVEQACGAGAVERFVAAMSEQAEQAEAESDDKEDGGRRERYERCG